MSANRLTHSPDSVERGKTDITEEEWAMHAQLNQNHRGMIIHTLARTKQNIHMGTEAKPHYYKESKEFLMSLTLDFSHPPLPHSHIQTHMHIRKTPIPFQRHKWIPHVDARSKLGSNK